MSFLIASRPDAAAARGTKLRPLSAPARETLRAARAKFAPGGNAEALAGDGMYIFPDILSAAPAEPILDRSMVLKLVAPLRRMLPNGARKSDAAWGHGALRF